MIAIHNEDPKVVFKSIKALLTAQQSPRANFLDRFQAARELGALYAREFHGEQRRRIYATPLSEALSAADSTDGSLGTLAGSLVTQRTLELLRYQFPALKRFTTDFSDIPGQFNQTVISRVVNVPDVQDYDSSNGWNESTATTTDVPVVINKHKGVPITFNQNTLAGTVRALFEEFAPASAYALGRQLVNDLYSNITDANFTNNTVVVSADFNRGTVIDIGTQLTLRGVPQGPDFRTMLLYPTLFGNLSKDTALVNFAAFQRAEMFEEGREGKSTSFAFPVQGFDVHEAPNIPTNNGNVTGFAGSRSALVIASRVPNDYTQAMKGSSYGNVYMVRDEELGLTVLCVEYVNHDKGTATRRIAVMYGTAPGQTAAGQLIKAAYGTGSGR